MIHALPGPMLAALLCSMLTSASASQIASDAIDLTGYSLTFDEEFRDLSVSSHGPGTRWIAHTPWNGDFGDAQFADPEPGFPFAIKNSTLFIEARKEPDGKWRSGLLCSRNNDGPDAQGFAQQYGYFEIKAKLPPGPGVWPGFWLIGTEKSQFSAEIDVMEQYGVSPNNYQMGVHIWRPDGKSTSDGSVTEVPDGIMQRQFNTYGVLIDADWMTFYFNRRQVWRRSMEAEFRMPFYILVNLALGSGWPIDQTINPSILEIQYIKVYERHIEKAPSSDRGSVPTGGQR